MNNKDRKYGIDIIRIIAVILVLSVHFFLNTKYYDIVDLGGNSIRLQTIIRNFCVICVPLFMTITGFLNKKTEYNKSFFKGLFNVLIVWFFYSLIEFFILNLVDKRFGGFDFINFINHITNFYEFGYTWYIEMYIGLYLIAPVINNAYNSFNKKNRLYLLILSIAMIVLPNFINNVLEGIVHFPDWWNQMFPIPFYICGKYIADNKPKFKKKTLIILLILTQIFIFSYDYIAAIDNNNIPIFITTILVFLLFYDLEIKNKYLQKIISYFSAITLDIYLGSSLIDKLLYPIFNAKMDAMGVLPQNAILYAPIILVIVFVLCVIYGSIRKLIINVR